MNEQSPFIDFKNWKTVPAIAEAILDIRPGYVRLQSEHSPCIVSDFLISEKKGDVTNYYSINYTNEEINIIHELFISSSLQATKEIEILNVLENGHQRGYFQNETNIETIFKSSIVSLVELPFKNHKVCITEFAKGLNKSFSLILQYPYFKLQGEIVNRLSYIGEVPS